MPVVACLECGGLVPPRDRSCGGNQPGFCSAECRKTRKLRTRDEWLKAHRDRVSTAQAEHRKVRLETHPDYFRQHYAKNKERRKTEASNWYRANAEYAIQRQKAYATKRLAEDPETVRALKRRSANKRRAVKKRLFVEDVDPRVVFTRDQGVCGICHRPVDQASKWEIDHVIPMSKGGIHGYDNVQLSHRECNRSKSAAIPTGQPTLFQVAV